MLLETTEDSLDSYDYHISRCGEDAFTKIILEQNYSHHNPEDNDEVDEHIEDNEDFDETDLKNKQFFTGTNEILKIFNEKCNTCWKNPVV